MDYITIMEEVIDEQRLDWLGNVARQTDEKLPKRFLITWIMNLRNNCGHKHTPLYETTAHQQSTECWCTTEWMQTYPRSAHQRWIPLAKEIGQWKSLIYKHQND
jgi:hypothetical protein